MSGFTSSDLQRGLGLAALGTASGSEADSQKAAEEFIRNGRSIPYEKEFVRKDGSRWWGLVSAARLNEAEGVKFVIEITARRNAEAALRQSQADLREALVKAETARQEVEAANRSKDHFLAVLSHELRTPLTPVLVGLKILSRRTDLPVGAFDIVEMIERNIRIEARFIDDLLDLTRIGQGKLAMVMECCSLHDIIRRAVETTANDIQEKRQELKLTLDAASDQVRGDAQRLQQVVWNLLRNASKFTPQAGRIVIRSFNAADWVVVEVADTGVGFQPEMATRIFQAFTQANESISKEFGGLGLGLAIAKATVEAHGGQINAQSAGLGKGAIFQVKLKKANA